MSLSTLLKKEVSVIYDHEAVQDNLPQDGIKIYQIIAKVNVCNALTSTAGIVYIAVQLQL
jgi:hypothetical protein